MDFPACSHCLNRHGSIQCEVPLMDLQNDPIVFRFLCPSSSCASCWQLIVFSCNLILLVARFKLFGLCSVCLLSHWNWTFLFWYTGEENVIIFNNLIFFPPRGRSLCVRLCLCASGAVLDTKSLQGAQSGITQTTHLFPGILNSTKQWAIWSLLALYCYIIFICIYRHFTVKIHLFKILHTNISSRSKYSSHVSELFSPSPDRVALFFTAAKLMCNTIRLCYNTVVLTLVSHKVQICRLLPACLCRCPQSAHLSLYLALNCCCDTLDKKLFFFLVTFRLNAK